MMKHGPQGSDRTILRIGLIVLLWSAPVWAQADRPQIQSGKIKSVDREQGRVTVTTPDGKERVLQATDRTQFRNGRGENASLADDAFEAGASVQFLVERQRDADVFVAMRIAGGRTATPREIGTLVPLTELGDQKYKGFEGGLYPEGRNTRPEQHERAGLAVARSVVPLDRNGEPSREGRIVLLSIGMSNTSQVFAAFKQLADRDESKNPRLVIVNGAQGGMTAARIQDPDSENGGRQYWTEMDRRLQAAGVSPQQVQAVWIKQADAGPTQGFPGYARTLQDELQRIVRGATERYPNLKLAYLSSRTYGGYATTGLNPEPYAYESAFSTKWLIEKQLAGDPELNFDPERGKRVAPWMSWGPYLWVRGTTPRADGFTIGQSDYVEDGTHHTPAGAQKHGTLLLKFFKADTTTKGWFVK